jgi:hypothetical protein
MMRQFGSSLFGVAFDVPLALLSKYIEVHEKIAQVKSPSVLSRHQINWEISSIFCGLLRKPELYQHI